MDSYLEIKEFSKCSKQDWNTFCENSDDVWLWHHYDSIVAKSLWTNLENNSFAIIDNSNKKQFVSEKCYHDNGVLKSQLFSFLNHDHYPSNDFFSILSFYYRYLYLKILKIIY